MSEARPACAGEAVPAARAYQAGDDTSHRIFLVAPVYGGYGTGTWRAKTVSEADLIACLDEQTVVVETCHYQLGVEVERRKPVATVDLRIARSGELLASETFDGTAEACPPEVPVGQRVIHGDPPSAVVDEWLAGFANAP